MEKNLKNFKTPFCFITRTPSTGRWTALTTAIKEGLIGGAAIDVLAPEPPADDHPFFDLLERPNFILTPHVAWASRGAMQTLTDQLMGNIENFVQGQPSNVVGDF